MASRVIPTPERKITDSQLADLPLKPNKWHGEWNYTLGHTKPTR